ncbi:MAG: DUF2914 domain-containing protein [Rhizomicrobium sp.]
MVLSIRHLQDAVAPGLAIYKRYQAHFSAAAMVAGFGIDNFAFGRVDRPAANIVFCGYLSLAAGTIAIGHYLETRADREKAQPVKLALQTPRRRQPFIPILKHAKTAAPAAGDKVAGEAVASVTVTNEAGASVVEAPKPAEPVPSRFRMLLPVATQFALGSLWSGFLVFYSRSAAMAASWPFVLLLAGFLIGNETFRKYHSRLVFSSLLLLFAIYSYSIFVVPVFTRSIGRLTFIASGVIAAAVFLLFLRLLKSTGAERFRQSRPQLLLGAAGIFAAMNAFYFLDILPPLPLALANVGVYHTMKHEGAVYNATAEPQTWYNSAGLEPAVEHVLPGQPLYLYSAVFAPIKLTTCIAHRWQWFDPARSHWVTESVVAFPINGGRDGGYRAYSIKSNPKPGDWRVDIRTEDGRLIGRLKFDVAQASAPVATVAKTLQ